MVPPRAELARRAKSVSAGCVGLVPPRAKMARMAKKWLRGDGFGRALAKKGLGSDEVWPKSALAVTIAK